MTTALINTVTTAELGAGAYTIPAVGVYGDYNAIGMMNKTTTAMTPLLVWGARVATIAVADVA